MERVKLCFATSTVLSENGDHWVTVFMQAACPEVGTLGLKAVSSDGPCLH